MRLGLCCGFVGEAIVFRHTTARYASSLTRSARLAFLDDIVWHNAEALRAAIAWCGAHGVGAFRVNSQIWPLYTHPKLGYELAALPHAGAIRASLAHARREAKAAGVRLSFHPDQFVVPGSPSRSVARASLDELEYLGLAARLIGAEQLTLHGGGAQGGKQASLERLMGALDSLSGSTRRLVVLENDDRVYTPADLLPLCEARQVPFVYDVHHHRCLGDGMSVGEATARACSTWGTREPWAHLSSPAQSWRGADPRPHAFQIDERDLPNQWLDLRITVDIEAKGKELAVLALKQHLARGARSRAVAARQS